VNAWQEKGAPALREALEVIQGHCDGAENIDGEGFNKPDASMIKYRGIDNLHDLELVQLCIKYSKQISQFTDLFIVEEIDTWELIGEKFDIK